jgi:hypothetical protein
VRFYFPFRSGRRAWLPITIISSGGQVTDLRAVRQVTSRSFLCEGICSTRRAKQKGAFSSKKEKDIILVNVSFSPPSWEVYLIQVQGNSIPQIAADLGF